MARDLYHLIVRDALELEGWAITHDPFPLEAWRPGWEVDLGAEKMITAERGIQKIAVEVKGFHEQSFAYEFHRALGQYLNYKSGFKRIEPKRLVYIAIPLDVYNREFQQIGVLASLEDYAVNIIVFDPLSKKIVLWVPEIK